MSPAIRGRIFLVGCSRAGTTLLQSLLAANSHVISFPETHFFDRLFPAQPMLRAVGVVSRRAKPNWNVFLNVIGHPELRSTLPVGSIWVQQFARAYVDVLDRVTLSQGKNLWLEKTPEHLRFVGQIERLVDDARFVHIQRNGLNNIASLYDAGQKYPETWGPWNGTLDQCIQEWIGAVRETQQCAGRSNHRLVRYEQLAANPKPILVELCEFIGVPFEVAMLTNYARAAAKVALPEETWKASVGERIEARNTSFRRIFDDAQQQYVLAHLPDDLRADLTMEEAQYASP